MYDITRSYTVDMKEGGNVVGIDLVQNQGEKLIEASVDSPDGNAFLSTCLLYTSAKGQPAYSATPIPRQLLRRSMNGFIWVIRT